MIENLDIVILGAGISGIFTSLQIKNKKVTIFEKPSKNKSNILKRVLVSGNGRCNFFNDNIIKYLPSNLPKDLINKLFNYFDNNGFSYYKNNDGLYYPFFNKSECFYNFLMEEFDKLNHQIIEDEIIRIDYINKVIYSKTRSFKYNKLVIATGGRSYDRDNYSYSLLDSLGIKYYKFTPGLVPIVVKEKVDPALVDNKLKCVVELYIDKKKEYSEDGEIIFKKDGLSGICIFNVAYKINYFLREKNKCEIKIRLNIFSHNNTTSSYEKSINSLPSFLKKIKLINNNYLEYSFANFYDFKYSHTSFGGIDLKELNNSYELVNRKDIFAIGEVLDSNYPCGGYNIGIALLEGLFLGEKLNG